MSLDLYQNEAVSRLSDLPPVKVPQATAFDSFAKGTGMYAMRALAGAARAVDMAGAVGPIIQDAVTGGTVAQDQYFREHDEIFNSAVDYWTPRPNEVGVAGEVVGTLLGTLGTVMINPSLAVGATQLGVAEDLTRQGVTSGKAIAAGAVQGAGLGLGVWLPILGNTGWQRIVLGGAGFNASLGVVTRGATGAILDGTPAEEQFKAFDPTAVTLDVLLGAAFGTLAHVSPAQRAQGAATWAGFRDWAQRLNPSDVDAIATLRVAQHMNVDSAPGKLTDLPAIDAHVTRVRAAVDQLLRDEPVELSNLPLPRATPDEARVADAINRIATMRASSDVLNADLGLAPVQPSDVQLTAIARERLRARAEPDLIAEAGAGDTHQIAALKEQITELEQQAATLQHNRAAEEKGLSRQFQDNGMKFKDAQTRAQNEMDARLSDLEATRSRSEAQLVAAQRAELARQDLDVLARGEVPPRLKNAFDELVTEVQQGFKPTALASLVRNAVADLAAPIEQPAAQTSAGARTEAQPGKAASPLPPPGATKPAGASAKPDLLAQEAQRMVAARPDERITVGRNPDGTPIVTTAAKYLADIQQDVAAAREQAKLFEVAAGCYLARA